MNLVRDYVGFAVRFVGAGYMALWPLTAPGDGFLLPDLSLLCGGALVPADVLCRWSPALHLSPGLHIAGTLSAAFVLMLLTLRLLRLLRRVRRNEPPDIGPAKPDIAARLKLKRRPPAPPPRRYVPRRSQFGLRGAPH